jgi:endonuclease/exonuclease/phosphatase family metal-dependent hydrolase
VGWVLRNEPEERTALDAWCWGVGPAVFETVPTPPAAIDSVAIVVWNAHIGSGDADRLIGDLRSGRLTGAPVANFVLLVQEVHRLGPGVPPRIAPWVAVARPASDPARAGRRDVLDVARTNGLSVFYAPSMRSGRAQGEASEDRGNAILSTLPLRSPAAIELPWERQRRVAVSADVEGRTSAGSVWALRLVSAHLDNRTRLAQIQRSLGAGRRRQAEALAQYLTDRRPTVLGADLNTWLGGQRAAAARVLRAALPMPEMLPAAATVKLPGPLPDMHLDYLLFRLPQGWDGSYRVIDDAYGSDHRPLLGWVRIMALADSL